MDLHEDERENFYSHSLMGTALELQKKGLSCLVMATVIAVGKSTYARSGIMVNITPAEACWEGLSDIRNR